MRSDKEQLAAWIEEDRDELIRFMSDFLKARSANPPGDTTEAAEHICAYLRERQLPHRIVAGQPHLPNIVGSFAGGAPGRHLVLNGHIDVFPPIDESGWSGEIRDGAIYGRGAADMKTGTAAAVFTFAYLHRLRDRLKGRLTLTAVSDEQTGGRWGTRYLFETIADEIMGDCCVDGEPSGLTNIRFMEKGTLRFKVTVRAPGGHGGYPHLSANPIKIAAQIICELERFHMTKPEMPADILAVLTSPATVAAIESGAGKGAAEVVRSMTVNIGVIHGGLKINQIPHECVFEVDIRMPVGIDPAAMKKEIAAILAGHPEAAIEYVDTHSYSPCASDPNGEMLKIIQDNVRALKGFTPVAASSLGGDDARYWRYRGVPAYLYGPSPKSMGRADEHVLIDEFLHVVRTHVLSAYDYLSRG